MRAESMRTDRGRSKEYAMNQQSRRVLILDTDEDTLLKLQRVLEQAEINTTITWDEAEACQLLGTTDFDLILLGDHPPELNPAEIIDNLSFRGKCPAVLILRAVASEKDREYSQRLGAVGVVPKRNPIAVLNQVTKVLAPVLTVTPASTSSAEGRTLRAAS